MSRLLRGKNPELVVQVCGSRGKYIKLNFDYKLCCSFLFCLLFLFSKGKSMVALEGVEPTADKV